MIVNETLLDPYLKELHVVPWNYDGETDSLLELDTFKGIYPDDKSHVQAQVQSAIASGSECRIDFRIVDPQGNLRWFSLRAQAVRDPDERVKGLRGFVQDVTERKKLENDLFRARQDAEVAVQEKVQFLANMSHEIRTPLGAILGFTDFLNEQNLSQEEASRYLNIIHRNGRLLVNLINDILDLSKVESGRLELEKVPFHVLDLMNELVAIFKTRASDKNLTFKVEIDEHVPEMMFSDPLRVRQIFVNLLSNAIKFTTTGQITIRLSLLESADSKKIIKLSVEDTGPGIPDHLRTRLFEPFLQADGSLTREFGGTGLGLALSKRLARALGGDLILANNSSSGTRFEVLLPLEFDLSSKTCPLHQDGIFESQFAKDLSHLRGLKVLVVDDVADNQLLIKRLLAKRGAEVDLAENGAIGVEKAITSEYDMILMDMQMPVLDGYAATRELRRLGFRRPILALTAHALKKDREKCLAAGCDEYLSKPIESQSLFAKVRKLTDLN